MLKLWVSSMFHVILLQQKKVGRLPDGVFRAETSFHDDKTVIR